MMYHPLPKDKWLVIVNKPDRVHKIECSTDRLHDVLLHIIATMEK
jgi:proteasome lid subunit RPN8/RPN11